MAVFKTPRGPAGRWLGSSAAEWPGASSAGGQGRAPDTMSEWLTFERRRHLMQPPDLFDEAAKRLDKFGDVSARASSSSSARPDAGPEARTPRPGDPLGARGKPGAALSTPPAAKTVAPEELGLRKARFFDSCLRADREFETPRRLSCTGPPYSAREKEPTLPRTSTDAKLESDDHHDAIPPTLAQSMGGLIDSCRRAGIPPATTGIIRTAGGKLQLEYGCMTDKRAEAIASSLRASASDVDEAHFRSNGLGEHGAKSLLGALPSSVRSVDLSQNDLGPVLSSADQQEHRCAWCLEFRRMAQLRCLRVSFSSLGDAACRELCKALMSCRALAELDLSGNGIYGEGPRALGSLVRSHKALESLDVHFNQITGDGARELVRGLEENGQLGGRLRSVNLAWNPLGKARDEETSRALARLLAENTVLTHLDISKCDLSAAHCQILADGLQNNTTLLGIHIQGNAGRVDSRGFLVPVRAPMEAPLGKAPAERPGQGLHPRPPMQINRSTSVEEEGTCCWVCDGWREICLQYIPGVSGPDAAEVWVFTSMDMFEQPLRMKKHSAGFALYLMAPAGTLQYVFQAGAEILPSRTAPLQSDLRPLLKLRRLRLASEVPPSGEEEAEDLLTVAVSSVSTRRVAARGPDEPVCEAFVPRRGCEAQDEAPAAEWSVEFSLFAPYKEALVHRPFCEACFDMDWREADIASLLRDEGERTRVKDLLRTHYAEVKMLYGSLCSVSWELARSPPQDREQPLSFGVTVHEHTHFLVQHNLVGDDLSLEDADAIFVVCALPAQEAFTQWHKAVQTNGHVLLRHSFVEFLVRLAMHGATAGKRGKSVGLGLEHLLEKHIMYPYPPMKNIFKCVQWRVDVLHTEAVETVYRKHMSGTVAPLFQAYSSGAGPRDRFLTIEGWFGLLDALRVLPCQGSAGQMHTWDRAWLWQISAMSHADELRGAGHLELVFVEFLEALARLVGLLRSRRKAAEAPTEEAERLDYGLGMPSAAAVFCYDKEGVMEKSAFAAHLDAFLRSDALRSSIASRESA